MGFAWITLTPESANLTPRTLKQVRDILEKAKDYAKTYWSYSEEEAAEMVPTKIDIAIDMKGSFIPTDHLILHNTLLLLLSPVIDSALCKSLPSILSLSPITDTKVVKGSNNLKTCL